MTRALSLGRCIGVAIAAATLGSVVATIAFVAIQAVRATAEVDGDAIFVSVLIVGQLVFLIGWVIAGVCCLVIGTPLLWATSDRVLRHPWLAALAFALLGGALGGAVGAVMFGELGDEMAEASLLFGAITAAMHVPLARRFARWQ